MMNDRRVILLFVKYPQQGRVKTRLAQTMGAAAAVMVYRRLLECLMRLLWRLDVDEIRVCYDPPDMQLQTELWLRPIWKRAAEEQGETATGRNAPELVFYPQAEGDLGDRLRVGFAGVFEEKRVVENVDVGVVAIGSDCIEMDEGTFQAAWSALHNHELVLGPTFDGGYYLLGMSKLQQVMFEHIPWSTDQTLPVSLQKAAAANLKLMLLDKKNDIDTEQDWRRAQAQTRVTKDTVT